ncbi:MAG: 16S rRNA (cytosine(1402)-N(4))-methyltransferase RsmH [Clostridia bacterium]|nr:16S rRNA (cytosine(1402)-N(4))-methyltransferase RsmH [Clostridia bacterium]
MNNLTHYSVMLTECIDNLNLKNGGVYFDGTLGGGGHSYQILKNSSPLGRLVATDLDDYALNRASERLKEFDGRFNLVKGNFKNFENVFDNLGVEKLDGAILDLGVSSFQLDDRERGFSYLANDESLDMRMDRTSTLTAKKIINEYSEHDIKSILYEYGEERFSGIIAKNIVQQRRINPIEKIGELNEIIFNSIPKKFQQDGHPSKRTFQALRIEVNAELSGLYETVISLARRLKSGGRLVILTFHSLEDRIVKRAFKELNTDCICDKSFPVCVCGKKKEIEIITKHPITATKEELENNSRSKSAKLRVAEKI